MKNMKYLRTWLVVALVVTIIGSLTGGTVAWFTDSVESTSNIIKSGTLDIGLNYQIKNENGTTQWVDVEADGVDPIFNYKYWEPGYTDLKYVQVVNNGDLAFKYQIKIVPTVAFVEGETNLADVIDVYYAIVDLGNGTESTFVAPKSFTDITAVNSGWTNVGTLASMANVEETAVHGVMLDDQKSATIAIALHMQEEAGNAYQNLSVGNGFAIQLYATQYTHENDAFDNQYDFDAEYDYDAAPVINSKIKADVIPQPIPDAENGEDIMDTTLNPTDYKTSDLNFILKFSATETAEEASAGEYADWHADFVVYADKDVPADSMMLAGQYDFTEDFPWIGLVATDAVEAGTKIRLLEAAGLTVSYEEICGYKDFYCSAKDLTGENAGTTMTVELWLYEATGGSLETETGNKMKVGTYTYTF